MFARDLHPLSLFHKLVSRSHVMLCVISQEILPVLPFRPLYGILICVLRFVPSFCPTSVIPYRPGSQGVYSSQIYDIASPLCLRPYCLCFLRSPVFDHLDQPSQVVTEDLFRTLCLVHFFILVPFFQVSPLGRHDNGIGFPFLVFPFNLFLVWS